jgi:branched-chain amino acid transport system permease protein
MTAHIASSAPAATDAQSPAALRASMHRFGLIATVIGLVVVAVAPFLLYPVFVMKVMCFALFAAAFNLLIGYGGLLSFGHAAFFGTGAYLSAHAAKVWGLDPLVCVLFGGFGGVVTGFAIGILAIRRKGIYFSMITLALSQMIFFLAVQAPFTGGEDGVQGVPRGHLLGIVDLNQPLMMYAFVALVFIGGLFAIWRIVHSPFGQILTAIRENEPRAISLGYDVARYKLIAFVISAGIAGIAGGIKALVFQLASLTDITWQMSGEVILITLLGGIGTLFGPVIGAVIVTSLENYLAAINFPVPVVIGGIFVVCVLLFRKGIVGEIEAWLARQSS